MNYILLAIPYFWLLIVIEVIYDHFKKTNFYRINDFINSINAGIISRMNDLLRKLIPFAIYVLIEQNIALVEYGQTTIHWIFAFVLYDFCYYWKHRFAHEYNFFWAAHVVHHSSEEYNLSTALRQSSTSLLTWIFYIPMALLGIDPLMLISVASLNLIYQFWVHTRFVPKLGLFEWFLITPSNHRVHHAINDQYIDKNYGGVFILWDRLFGTYQEELAHEPCTFGIRKPLHSWNPLWMNIHHYVQMIKDTWHTKNYMDKLAVWIGPTGWRPEDVKINYPLPNYLQKNEPSSFKKFDQTIPSFYKYYALLQLILILVLVYVFLLNLKSFSVIQEMLMTGFVIFSCFSLGMITEGRKQVITLEYFRYFILILMSYYYQLEVSYFMSVITVSVISMLSLGVASIKVGGNRILLE